MQTCPSLPMLTDPLAQVGRLLGEDSDFLRDRPNLTFNIGGSFDEFGKLAIGIGGFFGNAARLGSQIPQFAFAGQNPCLSLMGADGNGAVGLEKLAGKRHKTLTRAMAGQFAGKDRQVGHDPSCAEHLAGRVARSDRSPDSPTDRLDERAGVRRRRV